jgi:hypothetical protein
VSWRLQEKSPATVFSIRHAALNALGERLADRVDAHRLLRLLRRQPHVEETLAAQRVQQEAVLGDGEQHGHRVGELRLHAQAQHHILQVHPVQGVGRRVARAEAVGEVLPRARPAPLADREHVLAREVVRRGDGVEGLGDEPDPVALLVGVGEQLVLDVGDPDVAGRLALDRVRARRPHLGEAAVGEQPVLDLDGQLQVLPALQGDNLLAAGVAVPGGLPLDDAAVAVAPAALVHGDRHPRPEQLLQEQGEGQPDRPAARHGHPQDGRLQRDTGQGVGDVRLDPLGLLNQLEPEDLVADGDLVAGPERVDGDLPPVDLDAVAAVAVAQHVLARLAPQLGVHPRREPGGEHHVAVRGAAQRERGAADREPLPRQRPVQPDQRGDHLGTAPVASARPRRVRGRRRTGRAHAGGRPPPGPGSMVGRREARHIGNGYLCSAEPSTRTAGAARPGRPLQWTAAVRAGASTSTRTQVTLMSYV